MTKIEKSLRLRSLALILGSLLLGTCSMNAAGLPSIKPCDHPSVLNKTGFKACWDYGLALDFPGRRLGLVFGGRFLYDLAWFGQDAALEAEFGDIPNDTDVRRLSITMIGKFGNRIEFRAQPDFADFGNETRDLYIGVLNVPFFGGIRIGRQKEPIGLNEQSGQLSITFMERSLNSAFLSNRTEGVSASRTFLDQRLSMKYGFISERHRIRGIGLLT